jgi:hypothetical protein
MGLLQRSGAMAGLEAQGIGPLAQGRQGLAFLKAGLTQLRQGPCWIQLPAILQERGASPTDPALDQLAAGMAAGPASPTRWEA